MQRQDDFLRALLKTAIAGRASTTPNFTLANIIDQIEKRLPQLKPVAYENHDLSAGFSTDGIHHICGDKASIARVQRALNAEANIEAYWRPAVRAYQDKEREASVRYTVEMDGKRIAMDYETKDEAQARAWRMHVQNPSAHVQIVKISTITIEEKEDQA